MAEQISLSSRSSSGENDDTNCSATLLDLEALNCPICCDPLTSNIYQCDKKHIACALCCNELENICPYCDFPIGQSPCRAMERVIKAVIVPCPNAKLGCTKSLSYGTELTHEKECTFSRCYCPAENCDYTGSYKDIYSHFDIHKGEGRYNYKLLFGKSAELNFELTHEYTSVVLKGYEAAPSVLEVGEFSCYLTTAMEPCTMILFPKVKRIRKLRLETPEKDFMLVPSYLLRGRQELKLRMIVSKLNQE